MAQESIYNGTIEDIIFENRNKSYGAYDIRMKYLRYVWMGFLFAVGFAIIFAVTPYILSLIHPSKEVKLDESMAVSGTLTEPPPTNKELPPPPEVKLPEPEQIKFVPPKIVEVVHKEEKIATVEEVKEKANIGSETKEGTKDIIAEPIKDVAPAEDNTVYDLVSIEKMPAFPGGDDALLAYISNHIQYPQQALDNNIQGKVIVAFVIGKDGHVSDVSVKKGIKNDLGLNAEAMRVVKTLPAFAPGMQNGKPVRVTYTVPITFRIK